MLLQGGPVGFCSCDIFGFKHRSIAVFILNLSVWNGLSVCRFAAFSNCKWPALFESQQVKTGCRTHAHRILKPPLLLHKELFTCLFKVRWSLTQYAEPPNWRISCHCRYWRHYTALDECSFQSLSTLNNMSKMHQSTRFFLGSSTINMPSEKPTKRSGSWDMPVTHRQTDLLN